MKQFKCTIELIVTAEDEGSACDGVSEMLRPSFGKGDEFVFDWQYRYSGLTQQYESPKQIELDVEEYVEGAGFEPITPMFEEK